jgi:hypothetical protein
LLPLAALVLSALILPSCETDGHFCVLGYSTRPNYDPNIHSVSVPIFADKTYWKDSASGLTLDVDLTKAVIREIEQKTPFKVKQVADTELKGTIINVTKVVLSPNQFNYPREVETTLTVEILWKDCRTGDVLSKNPPRAGAPRELDPRQPILAVPDSPNPQLRTIVPQATPTLPSDASAARGLTPPPPLDPWDQKEKKRPQPLILRSVAHFRPELGESLTTALQKNVNRMAEQIVSAMEMGW